MKEKLEKLITELQLATCLDDLQQIIFSIRDLYDVNHIVYHAVNPGGDQYAALTYDNDWVETYIEQDYARIDPVVQGCYQRFHPVDWKRLDWSGKNVKGFLGEAQTAGVGNQGLSVPIRGPNGQFALFTASAHASDTTWDNYSKSNVSDLILVAHFINQKALELSNSAEQVQVKALSPREIDALSLLAMGYSRAQAADSLTISEHTLRVYIEGARLKLGAQNTTHAVARAIANGHIAI